MRLRLAVCQARFSGSVVRFRPVVFLLAGLMPLNSPAAVAATTITVNSPGQEATAANLNGTTNNNCTLGEAILAANTGLAPP